MSWPAKPSSGTDVQRCTMCGSCCARAGPPPGAALPVAEPGLSAGRGLPDLGWRGERLARCPVTIAAGRCQMSVFSEAEMAYLAKGRLGRLATIDAAGMPHVV